MKIMRATSKKEEVDLAPLRSGFETLSAATQKAVDVSDGAMGKTMTGRQMRGLFVFAKMISHNLSMTSLAADLVKDPKEYTLLDHFSIATLARASIDAALMTMYITEPSLSLNRWDFRRQLLFLHDTNNRSRFLKALTKRGGEFPFFENKDVVKQAILDKIKTLGAGLLYSEEKIAEYQKGTFMFVDGVRGAAREAGWDNDDFDFNQSYLSAFVHTHPVSFMRADDHDIKFGGASKFQVNFCRYVFTTVAEYTDSVVERMNTFAVPGTGDPNGHLD
jgi:hypothetical protein